MGSQSHLSQSHQSQPLVLRTRSPLAAAERAKRAERIANESQEGRLRSISSPPPTRLERAGGERIPAPIGGLTTPVEKCERLTKLCHFFREVKQDKGVTLRATKVSHYRVFTLFWFIMVSTPYQFSFTVVAIHFFIQGEVMDILPSSCSMT